MKTKENSKQLTIKKKKVNDFKEKTFSEYAQELSQMEIRKRKLHHKYIMSRALMNKKFYQPTGQSPRLEYGDKPYIFDEPVKDILQIIFER